MLLGDPEAFHIGLTTQGQTRLTQLRHIVQSYFNITTETDESKSIALDQVSQTASESAAADSTKQEAEPSQKDSSSVVLTEETIYQIDPMINMGQVTPYDFVKQ